MAKIFVKETELRLVKIHNEDYICITDMLTAKDGQFFVSDWMRNRNTLEFLGIWEMVNNPTFNYGEFAIVKMKSGLNNFKLSVKEYSNKFNGIGIVSKSGRYGGTYAHKDIALEFAMWISPEFKVYLIQEFQRLKKLEEREISWSVKRELAKINYHIHTQAIKDFIVPKLLSKEQVNTIYANEADLLNVALFGITAREWRELNPNLQGNMRDYASMNELICLSNLENINSLLIQEKLEQKERLVKLNQLAIQQMTVLQNLKSRDLFR
ncbi:MAG: hypothetical protein RLZZ155_1678 [Bacteroidota bacterium]|jgi:hypothetical protein